MLHFPPHFLDRRRTRRINMSKTEKKLAEYQRQQNAMKEIKNQHEIIQEHASNLFDTHENLKRKLSELDLRIAAKIIEKGSDTHREFLQEILDINHAYSKSCKQFMDRAEYFKLLKREYDLNYTPTESHHSAVVDDDYVLVHGPPP
jgi:hypothetical protein